MKAYSVAKQEIASLQQLYVSSSYAYAQTEEVLRYKARCKHNRSNGETDQDLALISPIDYSLKGDFRDKMRRQLRELVFIRLISILETYLVDTVRDVFMISKQPFKDQAIQINFTQSEILSAESMSYVLSKIINKECRRLTSGGFSEVMKYYRMRFDVDLGNIPPGKARMVEYHERRHLFVHRLGKTDNQYRKAYACTSKQLSIDAKYLEACFTDFELFIASVDQTLAKWLTSLQELANIPAPHPSITYRVIITTDQEIALFNEDFQFWVGDEMFFFQDVLEIKKYLGSKEYELTLSGNAEALRVYATHLRRAEKRGHLMCAVEKMQNFSTPPKTGLDEELISKVKQSLPSQPWPKNTHKTIAKELGISNGVASAAIQILISRNIFRPQINGKVLAPTKREAVCPVIQ